MGGDVIANATIVPIQSQAFRIFSTAATRVIVDVFGCFTTSGAYRFYSHDLPIHRGELNLGPSTTGSVGASGNASLVSLNVVGNTDATFLVGVVPGQAIPNVSAINLAPGDWISNSSLVQTSGGTIGIFRADHPGSTTVRVVEQGYFSNVV